MTIADEIKTYKKQIAEARIMEELACRKIREIQKRCPHKNCERDFDASGSNRTSYTCLDCGGDV